MKSIDDINDDDTLKNNLLFEEMSSQNPKAKKSNIFISACICIYVYFKWFLNYFGIIFPKAKILLPFSFRNKIYYSSKRITFCSFFVLGIILWNALKNIEKIGNIENFTTTTEKF